MVQFSIKDTQQNGTQQSSHGTTNYNCTEIFPWPFSDKILFCSEEDTKDILKFKWERTYKSMSENMWFFLKKINTIFYSWEF